MQLSFLGGAFSRATVFNANHLLARLRVGSGKKPVKKQGRRRSIPSTTLPAPDIEIGSRHPVNFRMPGIFAVMCEPVHKGGKKFRRTYRGGGKHPVNRRPNAPVPRSLQ
jgi:hypothetical protein